MSTKTYTEINEINQSEINFNSFLLKNVMFPVFLVNLRNFLKFYVLFFQNSKITIYSVKLCIFSIFQF